MRVFRNLQHCAKKKGRLVGPDPHGTIEADEVMLPGSVQWFFWFLCSRWGKTATEIGAIPGDEFLSHYEFWKQFKWGISDDQLSLLNRLTMRSPAFGSNWQFKEMALSGCGFIPPKVESADDLWSSIDHTFAAGNPLNE